MAFLFHAVLADLQEDFQFHKPLYEGTIVLETGIRRYRDDDTRLTHSELLTLTLNEVAMAKGWGKLYWIPDKQQMTEGGIKVASYLSSPNLIYEDRAWTEDDIAEYRQLDHSDRWIASAPGLRNGLFPETMVMPIRLVVHESEGTTSLPAGDIASVMLYYRKGEAYLGWMKDWLINGSSKDFLTNHRQSDNEVVMDQLRVMASRKAEGDMLVWDKLAAMIVEEKKD